MAGIDNGEDMPEGPPTGWAPPPPAAPPLDVAGRRSTSARPRIVIASVVAALGVVAAAFLGVVAARAWSNISSEYEPGLNDYQVTLDGCTHNPWGGVAAEGTLTNTSGSLRPHIVGVRFEAPA